MISPWLLADTETLGTGIRWLAALASVEGRVVVATLLGGFGLWCLLPSRSHWRHLGGGVLALAGAACLFSVVDPLGEGIIAVLFWMLTGITLSAAAATITSQSPVYSAIWFALMLLGVGGLFLINGAQFLGVATVAVYAGAIVVTFLFVLMLAQPEGHSFYDRISWGHWASLLSCLAGVGVTALIVWAVARTDLAGLAHVTVDRSLLADEHVAHFGARLFSKHLIAVQVAGTLLLAALVGAVAIASYGADRRERRFLARERGAAE